MRKRLWISVLSVILALSVSLFIFACAEKPQDTDQNHVHTFESTWTSDATNHWHAADCGHTERLTGKAPHVFGDDNVCTVCSYVMETDSHTHTYEWQNDATKHWQISTCAHTGLIANEEEHDFITVPAKEATCTEVGYNEYQKCETCGYDNKQEIAPHHSLKYVYAQRVTCNQVGWESYEKCQYCDYSTQKIIEKLEHKMVTVSAKEPTCDAYGWSEYQYCENCTAYNDEFNKTRILNKHKIDKVAHLFGEVIAEVAPTCTDDGVKEHKDCSACGYHYDADGVNKIYDLTIAATGHVWNLENATCTEDKKCTVDGCGHVEEVALGHDYQQTGVTELSCETAHEVFYECNECHDTYSDVLTPATGHHYVNPAFLSEQLKDGETCVYEVTYRSTCDNVTADGICGDINDDVKEEERHTLISVIKTPASCIANGTKINKCSKEGCEHVAGEEPYSDANAHAWDEGTLAQGVTTYTCTNGCGATKTAISQKENTTSTELDATTLVDNGLELKEATIKLDSTTAGAVTGNVTISADVLKPEEKAGAIANLTVAQQEQIGDSKIFNFGMSDDSGAVSTWNGGKVTITVPYALGENEDPESIAIWFISDNGEIQAYPATYSNGYATFETAHFSYYTVTKLTPAERCAMYEHSIKSTTVAPTCTEMGYTKNVCIRCGFSERVDFVAALGHSYTSVRTEPTCTVAGSIVYTCTCSHSYRQVIPALKHAWVEIDRVEATCTAGGSVSYKCDNCDAEYKTITAKTAHDYAMEVIAPICTINGYTKYECNDCGHKTIGAVTMATGHTLRATEVAPTCTEDGYLSKKCIRCDYEEKSNFVKGAHQYDIPEATCGKGQTCIVCGEAGASATGEHAFNTNGVCTVCGQGCTHSFTVTTVAPTCTETGYDLKTCEKCKAQEKENFVQALGHEGEDKCIRCGIDLLSDGFYTKLLTSLFDKQLVYKAENVQVRVRATQADEQSGAIFQTSDTVVIEFAELFMGADENGNMYGYGTLTALQQYIHTPDATFERLDRLEAKAIIVDGEVYLFYTEIGTDYDQIIGSSDSYIYIKLDMVDSASGSNEFSIISQAYKFYSQELIPLISDVLSINDAAVNKSVEKLIQGLFTYEEQVGAYVFAFDWDKVASINYDLYSKTVKQFIGEIEFEEIKTNILAILDKTCGQAIDGLKDMGIDLFAIIDSIEELVSNAMGSEIELETLMGLDKTIEEYFEEYKDVQFKSIIATFAGETEEKIVSEVTEVIEMVAEKTVYELLATVSGGSADQFYSMIQSGIKEISKLGIEIKITTQTNGALDNAEITFANVYLPISEMQEIRIDGKISVVTDYVSVIDYQSLIAKVNDEKSKVAVTENVLTALAEQNKCDITFVKDSDGKLIGATLTEKVISHNQEPSANIVILSNGAYVTSINEYAETLKKYYIDLTNGYSVYLTEDCGNWYKVSYIFSTTSEIISAKYYYMVEDRYYDVANKTLSNIIVYFNESQVEAIKAIAKEDKLTVNYSSFDYSRTSFSNDLYYNTVTGEIEIAYYGYVKHSFVLDETASTVAEGCTDIGENHYVCAVCGETKVEYYVNGHKEVNTVTEFVDANNMNCADGVFVIEKCKDCDEEVSRKLIRTHEPVYTVINLSDYGVCGGYIMEGTCPCGKVSDVNYNFNCEGFDNGYDDKPDYEGGNGGGVIVPDQPEYPDYEGDMGGGVIVPDYEGSVGGETGMIPDGTESVMPFILEDQNVYTDDDGNEHQVQIYTCEDCNMTFEIDACMTVEGCAVYTVTKYTLTVNGTVVFDKEISDGGKVYHDYQLNVSFNGLESHSLELTCSRCGDFMVVGENQSALKAELTEGADGVYSYAYAFVPQTSGEYTLYSTAMRDTYVELYNGLGMLLAYNDDGYYNNNFALTYNFTEGVSYTFVIRYYDGKVGDAIPFVLKAGKTADYGHENCAMQNVIPFMQMYADATNCLDGYVMGYYCTGCGVVLSNDKINSHQLIEYKTVELSSETCNHGSVSYMTCFCDQKHEQISVSIYGATSTYNQHEDENGNIVNVEVKSCATCGLYFKTESYYVIDVDSCKVTYYVEETLTFGDVIEQISQTNSGEAHEFDDTIKFVMGANSCEQGYIVTHACKYCDFSYTEFGRGHEITVKNVIDLGQYGCVCGGELYVNSCACGEMVEIFSECRCDFGNVEITLESIIGDTSKVANGTFYPYYEEYNYGYTEDITYYVNGFKCAVTDPVQCTFTYAIAEYYIMDGCVLTEYRAYAYGLKEDGTWHYVKITPTGNVRVAHPLVERVDYVMDVDGKEGYKIGCETCGSYHLDTTELTTDGYICVTEYANATQGYSKERHQTVYVYVQNAEGDSVAVLKQSKLSRWNQPIELPYHWEQDDFTYGENCERTTVCTTSYGDYEEYTEISHNWSYVSSETLVEPTCETEGLRLDTSKCSMCGVTDTFEVIVGSKGHNISHNTQPIKAPTCTQDGYYDVYLTCSNCDYSQTRYNQIETARDHQFYYDDNVGKFVCDVCGLENINGTSGMIIMEDLTDYDNGANYVVGYCNRSEVQFINNVCLVQKDEFGNETNMIILYEINVYEMEEVRAVGFSKAEVIAAAENYGLTQGEYEVRFSFVPLGSDGSFDYSLTFNN